MPLPHHHPTPEGSRLCVPPPTPPLSPPGGLWGCGRGGTCCARTVIDRPGALDGTALLCNSLSSPSPPTSRGSKGVGGAAGLTPPNPPTPPKTIWRGCGVSCGHSVPPTPTHPHPQRIPITPHPSPDPITPHCCPPSLTPSPPIAPHHHQQEPNVGGGGEGLEVEADEGRRAGGAPSRIPPCCSGPSIPTVGLCPPFPPPTPLCSFRSDSVTVPTVGHGGSQC